MFDIFGYLDNVDRAALEQMFAEFDKDKNGAITIDELETLLSNIGLDISIKISTFLHSIITLLLLLIFYRCRTNERSIQTRFSIIRCENKRVSLLKVL
jgi:hypothetical protein